MKRAFDIIASSTGLLLLTPIFLGVAVLVKLDSPGPVFFRQERMGKGFRPFRIYKFRTMIESGAVGGKFLTVGEDPRITRVGWILRKLKIDELPQLLNILTGEMSFVGPRPEVAKYVELFRKDYEQILKVRPGITDMASLKYRDETALLGKSRDPEKEYIKSILPDKIAMGKQYIKQSSFFFRRHPASKDTIHLVSIIDPALACQPDRPKSPPLKLYRR